MREELFEVFEVQLPNYFGVKIFLDQKLAVECLEEHEGSELNKVECYLSEYDLDEIQYNGRVWK